VKKDRRKFGLRKKKSSKGSAADLTGCSPNKATHNEVDLPVSVAFFVCTRVKIFLYEFKFLFGFVIP